MLHEQTRSQPVPANSSYQYTVPFTLTVAQAQTLGLENGGEVEWQLTTDFGKDIFENHGENNNVGPRYSAYLSVEPPVDLVLTDAVIEIPSDTLKAEDTVSLQWTVTNVGTSTGYWGNDAWVDAWYLSQDSVLSAGDERLSQRPRSGALDQGESYTGKVDFVLPPGEGGTYYLVLVTDEQEQAFELNRTNNARRINVVRPGDTTQTPEEVPIEIEPAVPSDLVVINWQVPATATAGQPFWVYWTVANQGDTTVEVSYRDAIYLSTDFEVNQGDARLLYPSRRDPLPVGASYTDSAQLTVSSSQTGNFLLLFQVNDNGTVYEAGATENNLALGLIFLESQPPSDLIVTAVTGPDTLEAHTDFGVSYTVKNTGDNPANGRWKQALYLSRDTLRDPQDLLLGLFDNSIGGLQVGQVDSTDQTVNFPALPVGAYYLLTETDANGQITEANEENNVGYLPTPVWVTVPELAFSTPLSQALPALGPRYFRVEVPDSLVGETARLTLKTADSTQATNELYVQYGALPERFRYDFTDPSPPGGNRTVIVPELATGTYYGLAYGQENGGGDQTMELEIVAVPFDLYTVNTNEGGNTGIVTVRLDGTKFEPGMEVRFEGDSLPTLISHYQEYRDPAHLYASFDLQGMPLGSYDVVLEKTDGALAR
ncbi:MAG TPA: hypothetical protein DCE41_02925, partial [Cytophagales bacterium]|nr:hypothetical protein [Cytophagales bacterium]